MSTKPNPPHIHITEVANFQELKDVLNQLNEGISEEITVLHQNEKKGFYSLNF